MEEQITAERGEEEQIEIIGRSNPQRKGEKKEETDENGGEATGPGGWSTNGPRII